MRPKNKKRNSAKRVKQLNEENIKLVYHVANKIARRKKLNADDLVSYGFIGLNRASELYDETTGNKFSTYAVRRIEGAILDGLRREKPWSARLEKDRCAYVRARKTSEAAGRKFDTETAMAALGWNRERVLVARSLYEPVATAPDDLPEPK